MALQWEENLGEYNSKQALYFLLHQEIQDANIEVKDLQQMRISTCVRFLVVYLHNLRWHKSASQDVLQCWCALFGVYAYFLVTCSVCHPSQCQYGCVSHDVRLLIQHVMTADMPLYMCEGHSQSLWFWHREGQIWAAVWADVEKAASLVTAVRPGTCSAARGAWNPL